jgi:RNA polymerase sigma factor (sigma-70 family)
VEIQITEFFKPLNLKSPPTVENQKEIKLYLQVVDAFARTTHQCVYIIDYYKKGFLYVSDNPLFLCGQSAKEVLNSGYDFYINHVPSCELAMLLEINEAGFQFYNRIPKHDRLNYTISYDFNLIQPNRRLTLINHKLTPLVLDKEHNIWLALCVVTHSSSSKPGNISIIKKGENKRFEYNQSLKEWVVQKKIKLSPQQKRILALSIQGLSMDEIAGELGLSESTVKFHKKKLFKKLDVKNIAEALSFATNQNLFE